MSHLEDGVLHALLDGEIPSSELAPIQAHLEGCAECRARLEEERAIRGEADGLVGALEVPPASEGSGPGGGGRGGAGARRARARPLPFRGRDLAWAATIVVAAGLGYAARGIRPAPIQDRVAASQIRPARVSDSIATSDEAAARPAPRDAAAPRPAESAAMPAVAPAREAVPLKGSSSPGQEEDKKIAAPRQKLAYQTRERRESAALGGAAADASPAQRKVAGARTEGRAADSLKQGFAKAANDPQARNEALAARVGAVAPAAPAAAAAGQIRFRGAARADTSLSRRDSSFRSDSRFRLEEMVVTGASEGGAKPKLPLLSQNATKANPPVALALTFPDAIARLGGTIRLIEGLVPLRVEALDARVRVIYAIAGSGELALEQWRTDTGVSWKLSAPPGFPADSLERLAARVRE